ncbi:hypothetical protein PROFUN_00713 [Planoprotostelium fungivorum]|uniref:Uncharacterized protein n=1 Tax=Planoprotostelium fungivorum TaxID=1890364 RepID=A0A2P6NU60_9EUKA|nr:hypothetical protein PROFUN_00713 [Planoprotostelium fungivorum]
MSSVNIDVISLGAHRHRPSRLYQLKRNQDHWLGFTFSGNVAQQEITLSLRKDSKEEPVIIKIPLAQISALDFQYSKLNNCSLLIEVRKPIAVSAVRKTPVHFFLCQFSSEDVGQLDHFIKSSPYLMRKVKRGIPRYLFEMPLALLLPFYSRQYRQLCVAVFYAIQIIITLSLMYEIYRRLPLFITYPIDTIPRLLLYVVTAIYSRVSDAFNAHPILSGLITVIFGWPLLGVSFVVGILWFLFFQHSAWIYIVYISFVQVMSIWSNWNKIFSLLKRISRGFLFLLDKIWRRSDKKLLKKNE